MRLGIVAYASDTGLGNQTYELYRHMQPAKTLVINLSHLNKMPVDLSRYPDARVTDGFPTEPDLDWLTTDVDAIFVCETPLNFELYRMARAKGVKTIQQYNYEFLDYFTHRDWPTPDVLAAPTSWNIESVRTMAEMWPGIKPKVIAWPVPVNRQMIPFRKITKCQTFIHVVGRPAVHDRNGTIAFLEAASKIGNHATYKIYIQPPSDERAVQYFQPVKEALEKYSKIVNIEIIENTPSYTDIWNSGDVLVLPRRYGGLCLPMQEALAAGMPVIMPNISPNNDMLPKEWLVYAKQQGSFTPRPTVQLYSVNAHELAFKMLQFMRQAGFIEKANSLADEIAQHISWEELKPKYEQLLEEVCR